MLNDILRPRKDVLDGRLQGVIDIERVSDPKRRALEARVKDFFASTFVSGEIRQLVSGLQKRLNSAESETGLFLAEGRKGEGKSHVLLVALHLVQSPSELQDWLAEHHLEFSIPANTRVIWRKFTDFPLESLWGVIAEELKVAFPKDRPPNIDDFRTALGDRKLVLILDELESGIRAIPNDALRQQNLNFLQMLSEEANRAASNLAIVASIYDGGVEPGLTLKRVARVELRFRDSSDRRRILFHRLFSTDPLAPSPAIDATVQSHLAAWRRFGIVLPPDYPEDLRASYPFTPEALEVVLERIRTSRGGFQGTRGALGFLAALVRLRCQSAHLITLSSASLAEAEMRSWLADLDPSQNLLTCAEANLRELRNNPFADQIASAVLLGSLAPSPKEPGITEDELSRQVIGPDADFNMFRIALGNFKRLGSYFHERAGSLFFDTRENAHSKVNLRALSISDDEAWTKITAWWANDILRDSEFVIFESASAAQAALDAKVGLDVRLVAAPRRLPAEDIHKLHFGLKRRNTLVVIEPREDKVDLRNNPDLLKYAKSWLAADYLARTAGDASRSTEFSKIGAEDKKNAIDYLRRINFVYVQILRYGATPGESDFHRENLPASASREQILQHLSRNLYPVTLLREHLAGRIGDLIGKRVGQIEAEYRNTPGFPLLTSLSVFHEAICGLVEDGTTIALRHPAGDACGRRPRLTSDQLSDAVISEPFDVVRPPSPAPEVPESASAIGAPEGRTHEGAPSAQPGSSTLQPDVGGEILSTAFLATRQQIRHELARLLQEHGEGEVARVRFGITFDERQQDIGSLPAFLRGSLTGAGAFGGEISIEFNGVFSKARVEEMVERLPDFTPGSCRVTFTMTCRQQEPSNV